MSNALEAVFMVAGAAFILLAALGIYRMPDLFTRMQAATKAATLGLGCLVFALAVHFGDADVSARALLIMVFGFLTVPVAAHMVGRAAYFVGVPLWERTAVDELKGRYDPETHILEGARPEDGPQQAPPDEP